MLTIDFTGIYENEDFDFYKETTPRSLFASNYISLKDVSGTNCICDDYAREEIKNRLSEALQAEADNGGLNNPRITFFDNGNYHYMSRILMENMGTSFDLIVFDNHPDMKWTSYGDILSCGCWVLSALKDIPELKNVYIVGANKALMEEAFMDNPEVTDRVRYYEDFISFRENIENGRIIISEKLYISVDKDVVSKDELFTNWDQGTMSINELITGLTFLKEHYARKILAVDVCGECTPDSEDAFLPNGIKISNRLNSNIISVFLKTL